MNNKNLDLILKAADKLAKAADRSLKNDALDNSRILVALFEYNLTKKQVKDSMELELKQFNEYYKQ